LIRRENRLSARNDGQRGDARSGRPPPVEDEPTVRAVEETRGPLKPVAAALMVVVPAASVVARPEALIVATDGLLEVQVTPSVTSWVEGWLALPYVPTATNCTVWPAVTDGASGLTCMESSPEGLEQPVIGITRPVSNSAPKNNRSRIRNLLAVPARLAQADP